MVVLAKEARSWRVEGHKRRITGKECQRLMNSFKWKGFYGAKRIVESRERRIIRERGALPKEEGDAIGEHKAVHEENLLSSWIREDGREKEERTAKMSDYN